MSKQARLRHFEIVEQAKKTTDVSGGALMKLLTVLVFRRNPVTDSPGDSRTKSQFPNEN